MLDSKYEFKQFVFRGPEDIIQAIADDGILCLYVNFVSKRTVQKRSTLPEARLHGSKGYPGSGYNSTFSLVNIVPTEASFPRIW